MKCAFSSPRLESVLGDRGHSFLSFLSLFQRRGSSARRSTSDNTTNKCSLSEAKRTKASIVVITLAGVTSSLVAL